MASGAPVEGDAHGTALESEDLGGGPPVWRQLDGLSGVEEAFGDAGDVVETATVGHRRADGFDERSPVEGGVLFGNADSR